MQLLPHPVHPVFCFRQAQSLCGWLLCSFSALLDVHGRKKCHMRLAFCFSAFCSSLNFIPCRRLTIDFCRGGSGPSFLAAQRWHAEDLHVAAGCVSPGWSAFQVFLHDHPWGGWAYTSGWGEQGGQKQPSAPDVGGLAGFVLPSGLLSRCSLLCFTHNLVTYFQCCCQDPLPSPSWPFFPPTVSLLSGLCGFLNSPSSLKNGHQLLFPSLLLVPHISGFLGVYLSFLSAVLQRLPQKAVRIPLTSQVVS